MTTLRTSIQTFAAVIGLALAAGGGCDLSEGLDADDDGLAPEEISEDGSMRFEAPERATAGAHNCGPSGYTCDYQFGDSSFAVRVFFFGPIATRYRAVVTCTNGSTRFGSIYTVNSGTWSRATCPTNTFVTGNWFDLFF